MRQLKITYTLTNRDSTSVEKYFNEVSKEQLLSADEEVDLAKRIREGDEQALHKLVRANLRFVVSVAKQYQYGKLPLSDLINEGNLGLIKAAKMYDETRGFKFISYAVWWIRQSIMQALAEHSRLVRIPYNKTNELMKINNATSVIEQIVEREPTAEELAEFMGVSVESVNNAQAASIRQTSLDAPFDDDDGSSLLDIIKDPESEYADTALVTKGSLKVELKRLLSRLNEREQLVIKQFFGIDYDFNYTLEDIAAN
ncbi:MAG TPA: RNA polymerase sigma factor RpoD/SigA, partial [Cytophagaceae bacterium]